MDLVAKFWNFCHTLRHDGVDYQDYLEELTYFLFLKLASEKGVEIPKGCNWTDLVSSSEDDLYPKYTQILEKLSQQRNILGDIFKQPIAKIRNPNSLRRLLTLIDDIEWMSFNQDIMGVMFEGLLEKAANESKKGAGQYFTPRALIESVVEVMKPNPLEADDFKLADVACGTAGFIISSYDWWKNKFASNLSSHQKQKEILNKTYYGKELVVRPRRLAQMNFFLHNLNPLNIELGDTIYEPLGKRRYTCILTNPPFGTKGSFDTPHRKDFFLKTSNKQLNFVQHVYSILKDKGRAAIVLPDNVLFEDKAGELWKRLMMHCNIHTLLKLPSGTFMPYANVQANVIFLQKGLPTKAIWIYDARTNVESITKKERPLSNDHFADFINMYGDEPNATKRNETQANPRFKKFTLSAIQDRNYNLDFTWLSPNDKENSNNDPSSIAYRAINELELAVKNLKEVINLLNK